MKSGHTQHTIRPITLDGKDYNVSLQLGYDGIEYIGQLWFSDPKDENDRFPDSAAIPGRTIRDAVDAAKRLPSADLERRCKRALADKDRFGRLRQVTEEIITKIKYLNRVAVTMRTGVIEDEGAGEELLLIQQQILDIVKTLPIHVAAARQA